MPFKQTITMNVIATSRDVEDIVRVAVAEDVEVTDVVVTSTSVVENLGRGVNRERLINLAAWAAGEKAKEDLGLPSEWRQSNWLTRTDCGTACCIAGKVALEDGGQPKWREYRRDGYEVSGKVDFPDGRSAVVEEYAADVLGLDESEATRLFDYRNTLEDLLFIIKGLVADVPDVPDVPF